MSSINNSAKDKSDEDVETALLVQKFLENGGTITQCVAGARTEDIGNIHGWGHRRKAQTPTVEVDVDAE